MDPLANQPAPATSLEVTKLSLEIAELRQKLESEKTFTAAILKYLPIVTALLAVVTFYYGIKQFKSETEREYKKPLWEKQLSLYLEVTKATGAIASLKSKDDEVSKKRLAAAELRFWELYYGDLVVVENGAVSKTMVDFGKCLRDSRLSNCDQVKLMELSLRLGQDCRDSVGRSWQEPLGPVDRVNQSGQE